jgi:hypothetical protein
MGHYLISKEEVTVSCAMNKVEDALVFQQDIDFVDNQEQGELEYAAEVPLVFSRLSGGHDER